MFSLFSSRPIHRPTHRPMGRPASLAFASAAIALTALALGGGASAAHAQANLIFSGGGGSPLTLTLTTPITYTITKANGAAIGANLYFTFDAVGTGFAGQSANGTITYSINGGAAKTVSGIGSGYNGGDTTPDDLYAPSSTAQGVSVDDIVTLSSGTLTTDGNLPSAPPASGSFATFIANQPGTKISTNGVSASAVGAPEPGSLPLLGMGLTMGAGIVGTLRRRQPRQHKAA